MNDEKWIHEEDMGFRDVFNCDEHNLPLCTHNWHSKCNGLSANGKRMMISKCFKCDERCDKWQP